MAAAWVTPVPMPSRLSRHGRRLRRASHRRIGNFRIPATKHGEWLGSGQYPNRSACAVAGNIGLLLAGRNYAYVLRYEHLHRIGFQPGKTRSENTCKNGYLSDYNNIAVGSSRISVLDYPAIPTPTRFFPAFDCQGVCQWPGYSPATRRR